jgi:hypothetical protein
MEKLINGVSIVITLSLVWVTSKATNPWIPQDWGSKSTHIGSPVTTPIRVWTPSLVNIMLIYWQKEWNVVERSRCSCFHPMWKLTFCAIAAKVLWITSLVPLCSLPWIQCKKWIPIRLIGCVHKHQKILVIERLCNLSCVWNVTEKIGENNWKVRKNCKTECMPLG